MKVIECRRFCVSDLIKGDNSNRDQWVPVATIFTQEKLLRPFNIKVSMKIIECTRFLL